MNYVCRGFPVWLRDIPGIEFRTNNAPFKVKSFVGWHYCLLCLFCKQIYIICLCLFVIIPFIQCSQFWTTIDMANACSWLHSLLYAGNYVKFPPFLCFFISRNAPQCLRAGVGFFELSQNHRINDNVLLTSYFFKKKIQEEMKRFVSKVVNLMREERLFSWQGGPIILLQVGKECGFWALYALKPLIGFTFHNLKHIHSPAGVSKISSEITTVSILLFALLNLCFSA